MHLKNLAAALLPGWGLVLPIVLTVRRKEQSHFVAAHARQALGWQAAGLFVQMALLFVGIVIWMGAGMMSLRGALGGGSGTLPGGAVTAKLLDSVPLVLPLCLYLPVAVWGLVAAVKAAQGAVYRYPLVGALFDRFGD